MKLILTTAAAAMTLALPAGAIAAPTGSTATLTGTGTAELIAPIHVACPGEMDWGLAPQHFEAEIKMDTDGSPLDDLQHISVPGGRNQAVPGHCDVTGEKGMTFRVTVPATTTLTKVDAGPAATMTMKDFTITADDASPPYDPFLRKLSSTTGYNGFDVGATLVVGADQTPGKYQGYYRVTVQYN